ncbi:hypothetical protein ACQX29_03935 [Corynebacterium diphtheriae]
MVLRRLVVVACMGALLTGCGTQPTQVTDSRWQVTAVHTTPEYPSFVPDAIAGTVYMSFGRGSVAGYTGCARFQGTAHFSDDQVAEAAPEAASRVTMSKVRFQPIDDSCEGHHRYLHDSMVSIIADSTLDIHHGSSQQMVLTRQVDQVDKPSISLVANHVD